MRLTALLLTVLTLGGCMSLDQLKPELDTTPIDNSYYMLDTKKRLLCIGNSTRCVDVNTIISSTDELTAIERTYNQTVTPPNYIVSLMRLMLRPQDGSHKATPISGKAYHYKIPATDKMDVVWRALKRSNASHYGKAN